MKFRKVGNIWVNLDRVLMIRGHPTKPSIILQIDARNDIEIRFSTQHDADQELAGLNLYIEHDQ